VCPVQFKLFFHFEKNFPSGCNGCGPASAASVGFISDFSGRRMLFSAHHESVILWTTSHYLEEEMNLAEHRYQPFLVDSHKFRNKRFNMEHIFGTNAQAVFIICSPVRNFMLKGIIH
jgi:hypothetical protein